MLIVIDSKKFDIEEIRNSLQMLKEIISAFPVENNILCVCYLENHVFLGTRIDRKISARHVFYRRVLPAHLFRAR